MKMARLNGIRVHYADTGPRDGPPLVLSNSLGTDFRVWDRLLPHLPEGLRIIRYDTRGHGLTECPAAPYAIDTLVEDAAALIGHLDAERVVFVGLSIGGLIGQGLAAARPDLLRAMVLCDTAARIGTAALWEQRIEAISRGGIAAIEDQILSRWFSESFRATCQDELAGWRHMLCRTPEDGYLGCCYALSEADFRGSDTRLSLPVLAVAGEEDGSTPPALVEETAGLIPGARFELIRGAGHLPGVEQPEALGALVSAFLKEQGIV